MRVHVKRWVSKEKASDPRVKTQFTEVSAASENCSSQGVRQPCKIRIRKNAPSQACNLTAPAANPRKKYKFAAPSLVPAAAAVDQHGPDVHTPLDRKVLRVRREEQLQAAHNPRPNQQLVHFEPRQGHASAITGSHITTSYSRRAPFSLPRLLRLCLRRLHRRRLSRRAQASPRRALLRARHSSRYLYRLRVRNAELRWGRGMRREL